MEWEKLGTVLHWDRNLALLGVFREIWIWLNVWEWNLMARFCGNGGWYLRPKAVSCRLDILCLVTMSYFWNIPQTKGLKSVAILSTRKKPFICVSWKNSPKTLCNSVIPRSREVCVLRSVLHPWPVLIERYLLIVAQAGFYKKVWNKFNRIILYIQLHTYFKIPARSFNS